MYFLVRNNKCNIFFDFSREKFGVLKKKRTFAAL